MLQVNCSMAENTDNVQPIPKPYRWDENSSYLFQEALSSFKFQSKINLMNETDYENKIENLISDLNSVLCGAADVVLTKTRFNTKLSTPEKLNGMISLSSLKKNLDQKSKFFERYPRDPHVRGALFSTLKTYRKIRKSKIKEYHRQIIDQLDSLLENNPKKYWSLLEI